VAGFPKGSDAFFRLSPVDAGKAQCFAVRRGDLEERADAAYFSLSTWVELAKFPLAKIGDYFDVRDGDHNRLPDDEITTAENGIRYLRAQDLKEGIIAKEAPIFITRSYFETIKRSHIKPGYLLFSIMASIGNCAIVPSDYPEATANRAVGILVPLFDRPILIQYLLYLLGTDLGARLYNRIKKGGLQQRTNLADVARLEFPLPDDDRQELIVVRMNKAQVERRAKLADADALLAQLNGYVLETLSITSPSESQCNYFAATLAAARHRADADFHSPRFRAIRQGIEHGKYPAKPLAELCNRFQSGFAAGRQDQAFDYDLGIPHLRPLNLNTDGEISLDGTKFVPKTSVQAGDYCEIGEVLFNNTNSAEMVGKSAVFELDQLCACSNHVTLLRALDGINPHYLSAVFNTLRSLGYLGLLATKFNNQAGINLDTLMPLRIPCPPTDIQQTIATEVRRRRDEARRLRKETEAGWQAAKRWFEEQLLGPA
jgi:type I restriction enzyme S subunit